MKVIARFFPTFSFIVEQTEHDKINNPVAFDDVISMLAFS